MNQIWTIAKRLVKEEEGTETVEWAIVAALVIAAAAGAWATIGNKVANAINSLNSTLK